jgi:hypothetical protein
MEICCKWRKRQVRSGHLRPRLRCDAEEGVYELARTYCIALR